MAPPVASVTLKNVPTDLLERLRERARGERRSLNQEILILLERAVGLREVTVAATGSAPNRSDQVAAWSRVAGRWIDDEGSDRLVETLYRRRSRGRKVNL